MNEIIGYKGFDKDLKCIGDFQYEIGKSYEMEEKPETCLRGYHFCKTIKDVFYHYPSNSRICKVRAYGDIDTGYYKFCTNKIEILEEIEVSKEDRIRYVYGIVHDDLSNTELEELLKEDFVLDKYLNDECPAVRRAVAEQRYGLDILINAWDPEVRAVVADQGYGLDILVNDESWYVREAAMNKLKEDK